MAHVPLEDERTEEIITLQSIYPELVTNSDDQYTITLDLLVAPTVPLPVTFEPEKDTHRLEYLPSLRLEVSLPENYPAEAPPIVRLSTSPSWLPQAAMVTLVEEARSIWKEYGGSTILFAYISSVQEQAEASFNLGAISLTTTAMKEQLLAYNKQMKKDLFHKETFECEVCLEPKKGSVCYRMQRCSHVFCIACLQDYYNNCIQEGDVHNVKCMSMDCGKVVNGKRKERLLLPKELLQIPLSKDMVERYAKLKRKKKIESDPSILFCPRSWCQGAMRTEKYPKITDITLLEESDSEPEEEEPVVQSPSATTSGPEKRAIGVTGMDRLALCEDCNLAFCMVCLASWHGDFVRCEPRDPGQLTEDDQASLNFILKNTSPCPYCAVPCQKSMGCNHMTCAQCKTHFCYLCSAWLDPSNPYWHFNDKKNKECFERLMDGVEGEMGDVQFGGRRGAEQIADFWEAEAMRIQMEINGQDS